MDWVKIKKPDQEVPDVPMVLTVDNKVFIPEAMLGKIKEATGRKPRILKSVKGKVNIEFIGLERSFATLVYWTTRELADILGFKKVKVRKGNTETLPEINELSIIIGGNDDTASKPVNYATELIIDGNSFTLVKEACKDAKTFGIPSDLRVKDDNGIAIASAKGTMIKIPYALDCKSEEENWTPALLYREILRKALSFLIVPDTNKRVEETKEELEAHKEALKKDRDGFLKAFLADKDIRDKELRDNLKDKAATIATLEGDLTKLYKEHQDINRQVLLENDDRNLQKQGIEEFDKILAMCPRTLKSLTFKSGKLVIRTKLIYLEEDINSGPEKPEFKPFPLGHYTITVGRDRNIHWECDVNLKYSTDGTWGGRDTWQHPHILNNKACLGTVMNGIPKMVAQRRWSEVVLIVIQYLRNVNSVSDYWGRVGLKMWMEHSTRQKIKALSESEYKERIEEWAKYRVIYKNHGLKIGDKVIAKCPSFCPALLGKVQCPAQSKDKETTREGKILKIFENRLHITWKIDMNGTMVKRGCNNFRPCDVSKPGKKEEDNEAIIVKEFEKILDKTQEGEIKIW